MGSLTARVPFAVFFFNHRDCATQLRCRWFAARNAPGPASLSPNREWRLFTQVRIKSQIKG